MLALDMDGAPLTRPHGSPARVVIPEMYGYKGVKWLTRIELVADAADRLLGRARLRPERLGRPLEWLPSLSAGRLPAASRGTERALHWIHATAFCVLLGSGLCLYLPSLAELVGRRPLLKSIHIYTAVAWAIALVLVVAVGDRRALRRTVSEVDAFDADDRDWLRGRHAPQGRLNAGQKLNVIVTRRVRDPVRGHAASSSGTASATRASGSARRAPRPRLADVHLVRAVPRAPLPGADPPEDPSLAERDDPRLGRREDWARAHHAKWAAQARSEEL